MALTQQAEEMKLLGGRCSTTASQLVDLQALNASLQERLTALQAVNASLQGQLDRCQGRDAEAAYAHARLQASLGQLQSELARCARARRAPCMLCQQPAADILTSSRCPHSSRERLREQEVARTAAEAAAAKATAAAEAAADALAAKQQQLDEWRAIDHAAKQLASQQLQMSQVRLAAPVGCLQCRCCDSSSNTPQVAAAQPPQAQLEGAREKATVNETKLLDQIAALQQQLAAARVPRCGPQARCLAEAGLPCFMQHCIADCCCLELTCAAAAATCREPADAVSKVAHTAAVATLEEQVAGMRKEVRCSRGASVQAQPQHTLPAARS